MKGNILVNWSHIFVGILSIFNKFDWMLPSILIFKKKRRVGYLCIRLYLGMTGFLGQPLKLKSFGNIRQGLSSISRPSKISKLQWMIWQSLLSLVHFQVSTLVQNGRQCVLFCDP
jgi:hypothetical protein